MRVRTSAKPAWRWGAHARRIEIRLDEYSIVEVSRRQIRILQVRTSDLVLSDYVFSPRIRALAGYAHSRLLVDGYLRAPSKVNARVGPAVRTL